MIYLIRHGDVYNPDNILYGRIPGYGLSEKGQEDLKRTGEFLKDKKIAAIYASPMLRARQSAEIVKRAINVPLTIADDLMETRTDYQGRPFSDFDEIQSEIYLKPLSETDETVEQIANRMYAFFEQVKEKHENNAVAIISHGDPIMALRSKIEGRKLELEAVRFKPYVKKGEVWEISEQDGNILVRSVFLP